MYLGLGPGRELSLLSHRVGLRDKKEIPKKILPIGHLLQCFQGGAEDAPLVDGEFCAGGSSGVWVVCCGFSGAVVGFSG